MKLTNRVLRSFRIAKVYFPGHSKRVVALSMSPVDDTFISGSLDKTIRLWDLCSPNCQEGLILGHLQHLRCSMIGFVSGQGLSSAVMASSSSSPPRQLHLSD
uniref:Uncharacterized protein n=1 Tax=Bos mutus grunniens TaxID=30521 RepID=A0A8B9WJV6_BOSMU